MSGIITPHPWQEGAIRFLAQAVTKHGIALDASDTGTGKTVVALFVAKRLGLRVGVICPKTIIPVWKETAQKIGVGTLFVLNYEQVRLEKCGYGNWAIRKRKFQWKLPEDALLIFDECHSCRGERSQNSKLLMAVRDCKVKALLLSATAARNPLEMKALGYVFRQHNGRDFRYWCMDNGCRHGYFGGLEFKGGENALYKIHARLSPYMSRIRIADLGDQFPGNQIQALAVETGHAKAIDEACLEAIEQLEHEAETDLVAHLRARQKTEYLKVQALAQLAEDLLAEGNSAVIFCNFRETLKALSQKLSKHEPAVVIGGQPDADRQRAIERFQNDGTRIILVMIQAGGLGLSLHDANGRYPRVSLICPTFSAIDLKQALGRIHRAGAKSPAIQKIVFAAGTVEERVKEKVESKLVDISALVDGDLDPFSIQNSKSNKIMNTTIEKHAERAHAPLAPSQLGSIEICPGYESDNTSPPHPVTERGTAMHEALESSDDRHLSIEERELVQMCRRFLAMLQKDRPNALIQREAKVETHLPDCWGTVDFRLVEGKRAVLVDFKFGYHGIEDPQINAQAMAYSFGTFIEFPELETLDFHFLLPRQDAILSHTFNRSDVPEMKLRLETIKARRKAPDKTYNPRPDLCEYCANRARCPALFNKALPLAVKYSGDALPVPVEAHSSALADPADMAKALLLAHILEPWCESVKRHALKMRLEGGVEIPGFELKERAGKRTITNILAAWEIVQGEGVTLDEFLSACTASAPQLEDIFATKAPPRKKGAWKQLLADRLTDREALTSAQPVRFLKRIRNHN